MMTGEGGMVLTNDAKADKYARQIINHGRDGHSTFTVLGYNYRMTNLAASIGIAQLEQLESWIAKRISNADKYNEAFKNLDFIKTPVVPLKTRHVFHQYTLRIDEKERENFMQYLKAAGISCGVYYDCVLYKQPYYKKLGYKDGLCPQAQQAAKEVVSLPVHPSLSASDVEKVIKTVRNYKK
jgi:dTDP-4-amino-4,6-dideoxygalactose transaminase